MIQAKYRVLVKYEELSLATATANNGLHCVGLSSGVTERRVPILNMAHVADG